MRPAARLVPEIYRPLEKILQAFKQSEVPVGMALGQRRPKHCGKIHVATVRSKGASYSRAKHRQPVNAVQSAERVAYRLRMTRSTSSMRPSVCADACQLIICMHVKQ
jgi:hypothetical protein